MIHTNSLQPEFDFESKSIINTAKFNEQNKSVATHLLAGKKISRYEAENLYGIGNLHSRMAEVRKAFKDAGIEIKKKMIRVYDRFNKETVVAEYWIEC